MKNIFVLSSIFLVLVLPLISFAGEADIVDVKVKRAGEGTFSFTVTVQHDDKGWDHYANQWEVLGPDANVIGTRVLYHPHVGEQPFTRSLSGVKVPEGVTTVTVRARDLVHGYGGREMKIDLTE